jgi:hypothetical protein
MELLLERVNLNRQLLLSDSGDDCQIMLTSVQQFLKYALIYNASNSD